MFAVEILMFACMFRWYSELDTRLIINGQVDRMTFAAQNEAFGLHAKSINTLGEVVETHNNAFKMLMETPKDAIQKT